MIQGLGYNVAQPNAPTPQTTGNDNWESIFARRDANNRAAQQAEADRKKAEADAKKKDKEKVGGLLKDVDYTGILATDTDVVQNAISEIHKIANNTEVPLEELEDELYMKASELKFFIGQSKDQAKKLQDLQAAEIKGERIGAQEVVDDVLNDNIIYQGVDANGNPVSKELKASDVSTFDDMKARLQAREAMFQKPFTPFNIPLHLTQIKDRIENPVTTEVDLGGGRSQVTTLVGEKGVRANLENAWNEPALQRQAIYDYEKAKKDPNAKVASGKQVKDIANAKEFFIESYYPSFVRKDTKLEGTEKFDTMTKTGDNKARIGNTELMYYNDGKGKWTIDISQVNKQTENPLLKFTTEDGVEVKGNPVRWEGEDGKTPVLIIDAEPTEEMKQAGYSGSWFQAKVPYQGSNKAKIKYADPYEAMQVLGVSGNKENVSVKTPNTKLDSKSKKTIATKIQSTKDPKKFKITYTDGTSEIITE